jgi:hypothetical protein
MAVRSTVAASLTSLLPLYGAAAQVVATDQARSTASAAEQD